MLVRKWGSSLCYSPCKIAEFDGKPVQDAAVEHNILVERFEEITGLLQESLPILKERLPEPLSRSIEAFLTQSTELCELKNYLDDHLLIYGLHRVRPMEIQAALNELLTNKKAHQELFNYSIAHEEGSSTFLVRVMFRPMDHEYTLTIDFNEKEERRGCEE